MPRWAVASAGLAPVVLTSAWLVADLLQPASYSPMRQTVSALAGAGGTDRWIMTAALFAAGGCYLVTAAGLARVRLPGRLMLLIAGICSVGIATSPVPARGPTLAHLAWTVVGAIATGTWPAIAAWRAPLRTEVMSIRGAILVTIAFAVLLGWVFVETRGGSALGLAERLTSSVQTAWPFVVAVALRRAARPSRQRLRAPRRRRPYRLP